MSKRFSKKSGERLFVLAASLFLIVLAASAWLPRRCSYLKQAFSVCTATTHVTVPTSHAERELNRVPHQDITTSQAIFTTRAETPRDTTAVRFSYQGDLSKEVAYLQIKVPSGYKDLALITHPLLRTLAWNTLSENGMRLYQKEPSFSSIDEFLKARLPAAQWGADFATADRFNLALGNYTPLDDLKTLNGLSYVLTTFAPPGSDGSWSTFDQTFDLQTIAPTKDGTFEWGLFLPKQSSIPRPFLLGTIHIDYAKRTF